MHICVYRKNAFVDIENVSLAKIRFLSKNASSRLKMHENALFDRKMNFEN